MMQILLVLLLASCGKTPVSPSNPYPEPFPQPGMKYIDLKDAIVRPGTNQLIDIDGDGLRDINFKVYLVGDPILKRDRYFYAASSFENSRLLAAGENESPVMNKEDLIPVKNLPDFEWYLVAEVNLVQKVIEMDRAPYWTGSWVNANRRYLAFQVVKGRSVFTGWIQLSFDKTNGQIVLHQAAISLKPNVDIKAGL